ncbi:MAG: IPT/TIG domain-containing protein [Myxococcota bacterium]
MKTNYINSRHVKVQIPGNLKKNRIFFRNPGEKKQATSFVFRVIPLPRIKKFRPRRGWYGDIITLRGKRFCSNPEVFLRGRGKGHRKKRRRKASVVKRNRRMVQFRIPKGAKTSRIKIKCYNRIFKTRKKLKITPPYGEIDSVVPRVVKPGSWVTLKGKNFSSSDQIWLGSLQLNRKKLVNQNTWKVFIPSGASSNIFHYKTYNKINPTNVYLRIANPPEINSLSTTEVWYHDPLVVTGKYFCRKPKVRIGRQQIKDVRFISPSKLQIVIPGKKFKPSKLKIKCGRWRAVSSETIRLKPPRPEFSSLSRKQGPPGSTFYLTGVNFNQNMKIYCGRTALKSKYISPRRFKVTIIGIRKGKCRLKVYAYGKFWNTGLSYRIARVKPVLKKFSPQTSWHRGIVTIRGRNICPSPAVYLVKKPRFRRVRRHRRSTRKRRRFGLKRWRKGWKRRSTKLKLIKSNSKKIMAYLPSKAYSGRLLVKCYRFRKFVPGRLKIKAPVGKISSIYPLTGPAGIWVDIRGKRFSRKLKFYLGNKKLKQKYISSSLIKVQIPSGISKADFKVRIGRNIRNTGHTFVTNYPVPHINSFSPDLGWYNDIIKIKGVNFCAQPRIYFGKSKVKAPVLQRVSHTYLRVRIPKGAKSGKIRIICPGAKNSSRKYFTVAPPYSRVNSVKPRLACPGDKIVFKGVNFGKNTKFYLGRFLMPAKIINSRKAVAKVPRKARSGDIKVKSYDKTLSTTHSIIIKSRLCRKR